MNILGVLDGSGIYGSLLHYSLVLAFVGSALLIFFYCWKKGCLSMDEEAKYQMLESEDTNRSEDPYGR